MTSGVCVADPDPEPATRGDVSIDFVAATPHSYDYPTGGGAHDDRTIGVATGVAESLEGGDFADGDISTFLAAVTLDSAASVATDMLQTSERER
jgi:hypothetical protein